jgi:hypothetical protein
MASPLNKSQSYGVHTHQPKKRLASAPGGPGLIPLACHDSPTFAPWWATILTIPDAAHQILHRKKLKTKILGLPWLGSIFLLDGHKKIRSNYTFSNF